MYVEVPITGTGTRLDPFRPNIPKGVPFSAWMPRDLNTGQPLQSTCIIHINDREPVPEGGKVLQKNAVAAAMRNSDPKLNVEKLVARDEIQRKSNGVPST